jgi:hypothetical protein
MEIKISTNFADVQRQLAALQRDVSDQALRSAVNKTMAQAKTQMVRAIAGEFNLPRSKIVEKMALRKAGFKAGRFGVEAVLESKAPGGRRRAINVINFAARQTKQGLTAKIKRQGARKVVAAAGFIGNKGRTAFVRVGEKRLPIKPLQTVDVPQMFNTRRVNDPVVAFIKRKFPELFEREARYYTDRFNKP